MAYTKTQWVNNEEPSINATNLNKMEQGIADAQFPDGGSTGQILSKTNDGTGWVDAPTSAEWGNIEGQISEQTDLYSELESKITMPSGGTTGQVLTKTATGQAWQDASGGGNVDTVNGISPDANKNVQTATDLTEAAYEALPSTKESDNVDYYLTDADSTIATAEDIPYDNTTSGMTATNVQGAVDELNNGSMVFPNYSDVIVSQLQINSGTTIYTATRPCLAFLSPIWAGSERKYYNIKVNGNRIGDTSPRSANDAEAQIIPLFLNTGDVVTTSDAMSSGKWWIVLNVFGLHVVG